MDDLEQTRRADEGFEGALDLRAAARLIKRGETGAPGRDRLWKDAMESGKPPHADIFAALTAYFVVAEAGLTYRYFGAVPSHRQVGMIIGPPSKLECDRNSSDLGRRT